MYKSTVINRRWSVCPVDVLGITKGLTEGEGSWRLDASENAFARSARILEKEAGVLFMARGATFHASNSILSVQSGTCDCGYVIGVGKQREEFVVERHVQDLWFQSETGVFAEEDSKLVDDIVFF